MAKKKTGKKGMKGKYIGFLFVLLLLFAAFNAKNVFKMVFPISYEETVFLYSTQYNIDYHLVMAVIKAESNFSKDAQSHKGAKGLMQFTDETAKWVAEQIGLTTFQIEDIKDPETNIKMGCYYIRYLLDRYNGNEETALAAYNSGPGNVSKWLGNPELSKNGISLDLIPFPETRNYVFKVGVYKKVFEWLYK